MGSYSERTTCPHCGDRIKLEDVRIFVKPNEPYPKCLSCGASIRVSSAYRRLIMLITFALGGLIPYLIGLRAYIVLAWIPFWLLSIALATNFAKVVVPPKLEDAEAVTRRGVLRRNIELFVSLWLYWVGVLFLMALMESMSDRPAYPSGLFGLLEPAFVARTKTTLIGRAERHSSSGFVQLLFRFRDRGN